ncbi:hypothetical protein JKP88DRAFT_247756 [Tribonema minus]|uniref:Uncharacterized protein n=1 Tax=Tribonema minus TaxID=303371 RepID=A0A835YQ28_9STRA|nr:hypothetical protein JKP88DRAFT_247756 [Tribonema minus]
MTAELGDRLAQELVAVVARAGKLGIPLVRLSELVEVSGKKLVRPTQIWCRSSVTVYQHLHVGVHVYVRVQKAELRREPFIERLLLLVLRRHQAWVSATQRPSQPPSSHMHQFPSSAAPASSSSMPSSQGQHAQGLSGQLGSYALPPDMAQRAMVTSRPANKPPARCANGVQAAVLALRADRGLSEGAALIAEQRTASVAHWGLLGIEHHEKTRVFMATQAPFVAIATGRPGSGKTNTVGVLIENCLLDCDGVTENSLPMTTLIMHYDSDTSSCCELASLTQPNGRVQDVLGVAVPKVVVLVPPHLLAERTRDYSGVANVQVSPLLLDWNLLTAAQLTTLLGDVSAERSALLHAAVLAVMVEFEQEPISRTDYLAFKHQVARKYSQLPGTSAHVLQMQLTRLDDIIWQSEPNLTYARVQNESTFDKMLKDQPVVVADLSSTLYSPEDAGCLFAVMLQQFRSLNTSTRKLVVFDDVHRYATSDSTGAADCPLSMELVETCQRMHQANIRVIAASQRPHKLPTDIFSAANLVVVHRCQGQPSWGATLQQRLLLGPGGCDLLPQLQRGEAMVFASDSDEALESIVQGPWYKMRIRQRLTAGLASCSSQLRLPRQRRSPRRD